MMNNGGHGEHGQAGLLPPPCWIIHEDGLDTLLDSLSSLLVHWGLRRNLERQVSFILLFFMTGTGLYSLWEGGKGLLNPTIPEPDFLAFTAMVLSALLCAGL